MPHLPEKQEDAEKSELPTAHTVVGTVLLFLGIMLFVARTMHEGGHIPLRLTRHWNPDSGLWYVIAVGFFLIGCALLRSHRGRPSAFDPPGRRFRSVVLYTRRDCHLCDEARERLKQYSSVLPPVQEIDIDADEKLRQKFDTCVPVVEFDGKVRFRGRVHPMLLERLIEATPPLNSQEGTAPP
jgi:glutaredoxin